MGKLNQEESVFRLASDVASYQYNLFILFRKFLKALMYMHQHFPC